MESNGGMPDPMLPGMGSIMLGLEMPLQQQQHHLHHHQQQQHHLSRFASSLIHDFNSDHKPQQQPQPNQTYGVSVTTKATTTSKQQMSSFSDEEETASGYAAEDGGSCPGDGRGGKRVSPWQRMKWADDMVRLLIMVVFFAGDDGGGLDTGTGDKKKPSGSGVSGMLQKKGKWKSVSRAMLEKGYCVSPQQCEDKFNDLNKRYKRVNDILGKGTACRVVENQSLLESMNHIPPKMKEEVRKLLNSKHLFFREMCAYHSSSAGGHQPWEAESSSIVQQLQQQLPRPHDQRSFQQDMGAAPIHREAEDENENVDDDDDDEDDDDQEEEDDGGDGYENEAGEDDDKLPSAKRLRSRAGGSSLSPIQQQLKSELASVLQDAGKTVWEQRQWIRSRSVLLEEQRVGYQGQAFELEKQRFKWQKFSRKKETELERMKLNNERMRLENEKMLLVLRQKEVEIDGIIKRSEPSSITG